MGQTHETETGSYFIEGHDGIVTFTNSGYDTTFTIEDLRRMVLDGARVFEAGEEDAIREDGQDPAELLEQGFGYALEDEPRAGPMITGTDIMHAIDKELVDYLSNGG
jgi:hypothetical protein